MNVRSIILIVLALTSVAAVVMLSQNFLKGMEQKAVVQVAEKPQNRILVANETVVIGQKAELKQFNWVAWPSEGLRPDYITEQSYKSQDIVGKIVRHTLVKGAPLTRGSLIDAKDRSTTAAVLAPGMRAVSVSINAQTGVAGFAFAGDRVDVILTHAVAGDGRDRFPVSETVLQNVRLLGIDTRGFGGANQVKPAKTATLEVTPKMAEKVALINRLGTLTLALRSIQSKDGKPSLTPYGQTVSTTWGHEVSKVLPEIDKKDTEGSISVTRGSVTVEQKLEEGR